MLKYVVPAVALAAIGCDRSDSVAVAAAAPTAAAAVAETAAPPTPAAAARAPRVVFLGDSLTAGYGVEAGQAFPALVGEQLRAAGVGAAIVNAGVSGDTTAGGLRRVDWVLKQRPDVLVVCLGGNDGLRQQSVAASEENLRKIVERGKASGADVLLLGMLMPVNYGPEYRASFEQMYANVARATGVPLVPFVLEGVGGVPAMNQPDGIHPTAEGHRIIARTVLATLRPMVEAQAK